MASNRAHVEHPPRRIKKQKRFTIGFVVREAANCGALNNGRAGNRARSKSITVDAETLEQAITEKNLKRLLKIIREEFLYHDRRTTKNPAPHVPRRVAPPVATPYRKLLQIKAERLKQQQAHEELEAALAATQSIREETRSATPIDRPRPVRVPAPVARRSPPVATPRVPAPAQPPVASRRAPVPAPRIPSAPRRDPLPPLAPPPPTVASRCKIVRAAVATLLADVKHDHTAWCIAGQHADDPAVRRHHNPPRPPQRPSVPKVSRERDLQFATDTYRVKPIQVDDDLLLIEEFLRDG